MTYISASCFSHCGKKNGDNWISGKKRRSQSSARSQNFRLFSRFSCTFPVIRICAGAIFMLFLLMYHFFHSITLNMPGQEPGTRFFRAEFCRGSVFRIRRLREVCAFYRIFTLGNSHLQKTTAKLTAKLAKLRFFTVVFFRNKCSILLDNRTDVCYTRFTKSNKCFY